MNKADIEIKTLPTNSSNSVKEANVEYTLICVQETKQVKGVENDPDRDLEAKQVPGEEKSPDDCVQETKPVKDVENGHDRVQEAKQETDTDLWNLPDVHVEFTKWSELDCKGKMKHVAVGVGKTVLLLGCLYFFVCSLDLLSKSFRLIGGKAAGSVFQNNAILSNPVAGLMIGVMATVLFQSSSTTTGIAISMVVSQVFTVKHAIPVVMGANIRTSVTNTIVSLGQVTKKNEFRRAFAGATVHDMFNWLTVLVFLPLEAGTGYLYHLTKAIMSSVEFPKESEKRKSQELLKTITKPFTNLIVQLDKKVLSDIAQGKEEAAGMSIIKHCCKSKVIFLNTSWNHSSSGMGHFNENNVSQQEQNSTKVCMIKCQFMFEPVTWSDTTVGIVLLLLTLILLSACFFTLVRTLYSVMRGPILALVRKFLNANFPGKLGYLTGYVAILIGTGTTMLIQSSSVFTSALTPLVGIGILSLERMYPLTLGANLGTTFTAIIIALSQNVEDMPVAFHVALCHVFFNISGVILFYPVPVARLPIRMAKCLGNTTAKYRWFAVAYMLLLFVMLPAVVLGLSSLSWIALTAVVVPVVVVLICIAVVTCLQTRRPDVLPLTIRTWKFLPPWLRSLEPYDRQISKVRQRLTCCKCCYEKA